MLQWFLYQGSIVDEIADIVVERLGSAQEVDFLHEDVGNVLWIGIVINVIQFICFIAVFQLLL